MYNVYKLPKKHFFAALSVSVCMHACMHAFLVYFCMLLLLHNCMFLCVFSVRVNTICVYKRKCQLPEDVTGEFHLQFCSCFWLRRPLNSG